MKTKTLPIAWIVSNCNTQSKREYYVKGLAAKIQVDIFGHCGEKQCTRGKDNECLEEISRKYWLEIISILMNQRKK